jgi:hypothetical protein
MGGKRLRTDLSPADFFLLSRFAYALGKLRRKYGFYIIWQLGEQDLWLPLWRQDDNGIWSFDKLKQFRMEAVAIEPRDFKRICKYMNIIEPHLIKLLFKAGVLALIHQEEYLEHNIYRCKFNRVNERSIFGERIESQGYILVRERAECTWKNTVGKSALQLLTGL